ncbi:MAG: hypothetical protein LBG91_02020 [Treponema sp.]|jgi:hypothetical protein|nr:hypothetical protein [Treponema sp.]
METRKSYYSIAEAAHIKGIDKEEIYIGIRKMRIPTKQIGMRHMVPADWVFSKASSEADEGRSLSTGTETSGRGEQYLERIKPDLLKALNDAPEYGSCGILITLHAGKITKISAQKEITRVENK